MVLRTSAWRCQISCSGISVGSSLVLKTGSLGATPVDSMLNSTSLKVISRFLKTIFYSDQLRVLIENLPQCSFSFESVLIQN